jgi:hypothetical protein
MGIGRLAKKIRDRESELMPDQVTYGGGIWFHCSTTL